jgi:branched-subunit amino acid ABC-type transport system permease component
MESVVAQTVNSITWAMVLFLLSAGLTIIYGQMRVVNLAQGSFYLAGAYIGISVARASGSFLLGLLAGSLGIALVGLALERTAIRKLYVTPLYQILLTFGIMLVVGELAKIVWGTVPETLEVPAVLRGRLTVLGVVVPWYRVAVIAFGCVIALVLWLVYVRTTLGAMLRAIVDDRQMAGGVGVNVELVGTASFGFGAFLAALGGIVAAPIIAVYPGVDLEILLLGFAVVIIGGAGSLKGAFLASLLVGTVDVVAKGLYPELSRFTIFGLMAIVLSVRPFGLFGRP